MTKTSRIRTSRALVKTTLNLPAEASETLRELAAERNTTLAEVIRRALHVERYLRNALRDGHRILIKDVDDTMRELVIF